jgi:hypothetical protein
MKDRFLFFENFRQIADSLPDDLRLKFYDALMSYVFDGIEPEDQIIKSLIIAIRPNLDKEDGRVNNGGKRENSGRKPKNIENEKSNLINSNQSFSNLINSNQKEKKKKSPLNPLEEKNKTPPLSPNGDIPLKEQTELEDFIAEKTSDVEKFEAFWREYIPIRCDGRVVGKGSKEEAKKKFLKILKTGENYENIRRGLQNYLQFCQENGQLTCGVSVFLNQKRWLDDYDTSCLSGKRPERERQEPASLLEPYAQIIAEYRNQEQVW